MLLFCYCTALVLLGTAKASIHYNIGIILQNITINIKSFFLLLLEKQTGIYHLIKAQPKLLYRIHHPSHNLLSHVEYLK